MFRILILVALAILNGIVAGNDWLYNTGGPYVLFNYIAAFICAFGAIGLIGQRFYQRKGEPGER